EGPDHGRSPWIERQERQAPLPWHDQADAPEPRRAEQAEHRVPSTREGRLSQRLFRGRKHGNAGGEPPLGGADGRSSDRSSTSHTNASVGATRPEHGASPGG